MVSALEPDAASSRVPRLDEEPEIVKFIRCDAVQYEGDWAPESYDPDHARATIESNIEDAVEAERLGFDGIMTTEHHFDGWTLIPSPNVYLSAVAMRTTRLRIGQSVQVLSFHNPWRLAEETGMLDVLSNGRAELGVGKGNFSVERARYGFTLDDVDARFDEGLELLTKALREDSVTFEGKYTRIEKPSTVYPRPFDPQMRPWVAGLRPKSIERIGRLGHNLFGFLTPDAAGNLKRYVEAGHNADHELSGANYMTLASIIVAPTDKEAHKLQDAARDIAQDALTGRGLPNEEVQQYLPVFAGAIAGSPQTVLDQLAAGLAQTGARRLNLVMRLRSLPKDVSRQTQYLFATEIMPHLRHLSV